MTDENNTSRKRPRIWPGMPTRGSQMFESFIVFFLAPFGIRVALLLPWVKSCRDWTHGQAGQAPPLNVAQPSDP